jgi:hypothetical protein
MAEYDNFSFNADDEELKGGDFPVIPADIVVEAYTKEIKLAPNRANDGAVVTAQFRILTPEAHAGRIIFGRFNVINRNPIAQGIGRRELLELMVASGVADKNSKGLNMDTVRKLAGQPFKAKTKIREGKNGYKDENELYGFKSYGAGRSWTPPAPKAARPSQPAAAGRPSEKPPVTEDDLPW